MSSATSPRPESVTSSTCALSDMTSASASSTSPAAASATGSVFMSRMKNPTSRWRLRVAHGEVVQLRGGERVEGVGVGHGARP